MRQIKIGKVILTDGGAWNAQTAYTKLTYVTYNGDGWWSAKDNVNSAPSKTNTNWIQATDVQPFIEAVKQATTDAETINAAIRETENLRKQAETARVTAEQARVTEENTRKSNEQTRQSQESSRQSAEATRNTHEQTRETQEAQRQQADTQRQQNYERQMASVTTATELAQQKASAAVTAAALAEEKAGLANAAATDALQKAAAANTAAQSANQKATEAGNVNAVLDGDELTVTNRNGQSVTRNVRGPKGDSITMFPNVTIFGQPRIQESQISGFTANDYVQFPFLVDFAGRPWQIDCAITTGADVSQQHNVFDSAFGLAFAFSGGKFVLAMSSNGTSWNLGATSGTHTILANTTYYIRISWNGSVYKLAYSTNKETWTDDITVTSSESLASKQIVIGKSLDNAHIFNGSINMAEAHLTISGKIAWEGMDDAGLATRMAVDMSNIDAEGKQKVLDIVGEGTGLVVNTDGLLCMEFDRPDEE